MPLLVVWPGKVRPGSTTDAFFQSTDFFPTFADLLDWKLPESVRLDGLSQRSVLERNQPVRDEIFCHFPPGQARGDYEGMPAPTPAAPGRSLRVGPWKLIRFYGDNPDRSDRHELYDLAADPGERRDLAAQQRARGAQLARRLDHYLTDTAAVIPVANPAINPMAAPKGKASGAGKK